MPDENDKRTTARRWLSDQGQRSLYAEEGGVTSREFELLRKLIGSEAFGLFYSLLAQQRAEATVCLINAKLGTAERDCSTAVIQGQIRAIDQIRETLLDIADPSTQQDGDSTNAT